MSVNILNKEIKKAYSPQLTLCPFHHKRSRELFSKKNKKRTLINVLNKKIKKQAYSPPPDLPCVHFVLKGTGSQNTPPKNAKTVWMKFFHYFNFI